MSRCLVAITTLEVCVVWHCVSVLENLLAFLAIALAISAILLAVLAIKLIWLIVPSVWFDQCFCWVPGGSVCDVLDCFDTSGHLQLIGQIE